MNLPLPSPDDFNKWDWKTDAIVIGACLLVVLAMYLGILP